MDKESIAIHESGHAVFWLLFLKNEFVKVSIKSGINKEGEQTAGRVDTGAKESRLDFERYMLASSFHDNPLILKADSYNHLMVSLAGPMAQCLKTGNDDYLAGIGGDVASIEFRLNMFGRDQRKQSLILFDAFTMTRSYMRLPWVFGAIEELASSLILLKDISYKAADNIVKLSTVRASPESGSLSKMYGQISNQIWRK